MDPAIPGPIRLSQVLIDEYRAQKLAPALTDEEIATWPKTADAQGGSEVETSPEKADAPRVKAFYGWLHRNNIDRTALCISGGGIRSATFGLGLIQALARHRLLSKLDFLSTVSGGGYVGGWLSAWIHRVCQEHTSGDGRAAVGQVESRLAEGASGPLDPEPVPIQHLRRYSRYMSPRVGLFSADTWTLVAIFSRNLLLNWLVLLPLLAAILIVPRVGFWLVRLDNQPFVEHHLDVIRNSLYWLAVVSGGFAIAFLGANRPSLAEISRIPKSWRNLRGFLLFFLLPLGVMAVAITLNWAWLPEGHRLSAVPGLPVWVAPGYAWVPFALFGVYMHVFGYVLSWIWVRRIAWVEWLVVLGSGALGGWLSWLVASNIFPSSTHELKDAVYVWMAVPSLFFLFFLAAVAASGLGSRFSGDEDLEGMARASAWILIAMFARVLFVGLVIFGPVLLLKAKLAFASLGGVSGVATYVLCRRPTSSNEPKAGESKGGVGQTFEKLGLALAAPLFVGVLLAGLSLATTFALKGLTDALRPGRDWGVSSGWHDRDAFDILRIVERTPAWAILAVFLGLLLLSVASGYFVDVNRFSLHGAYRDRLIRAYLGASRAGQRKPNPFTGFDPDDNVEMAALRDNRPLHVLNTTLNLVHGQDLAWQDRKAETFAVSPLYSGNLRLGYRCSRRFSWHRQRERGITLGTAVATSGAAASPNMGANSSPVITFLLAFFNVRLGRWQGNPGPAGESTWDTAGPRYAGRPLFDEAFGFTDDANPYVYLSDGGHFENLGLYEMVMRRARYIVLSDAGSDPTFSFTDLGNAVAKIRVDFGVPIVFDSILMHPRGGSLREAYDVTEHGGQAVPYFAVGRIRYSAVDGPAAKDGLILYFKPSLNGTEPVDVFTYARVSKTFPHESTADQLYSEAQFEAYRALGFHAALTALEGLEDGQGLAELFARLEKPSVA